MSESEQTSKMYKVLNWNAVAMWVYNNLMHYYKSDHNNILAKS